MIKKTLAASVVAALAGCATAPGGSTSVDVMRAQYYENLRQVERQMTDLCRMQGLEKVAVLNGKNEMLRFIRATGKHGPDAPRQLVSGVEEQILNGEGPILRVYCAGEKVPVEVWRDMREIQIQPNTNGSKDEVKV